MASEPTSPTDTSLNVHNVEETCRKAVAIYNKKGMIADALLWQCAIGLLIEAGSKRGV